MSAIRSGSAQAIFSFFCNVIAKSIGLVEEICEPDILLKTAKKRALSIDYKKSLPINEPSEFEDIKQAFSGDLNHIEGAAAQVKSERAQKALNQILKKAPIAVKIADQLLTMANKNTLVKGLAFESEQLSTIFRTKDAKAGLMNVGNKKPTQFEGR